MITIILSLILSVSAIFGLAPTSQVDIPSIPAPEVGVSCEEDMECWDPETMGNGQGSNPMETDAYLSYDALGATPVESPEQMVLTYVGTHTVAPTNYGPNQFIVSSVQYPSTYHVLQWDTLRHA